MLREMSPGAGTLKQVLTLLTVRNSQVSSSVQRSSSRENHELVIRNAVDSDTAMYLCNGQKAAFLEVTADSNKVDPKDQPITQRNEQTATAAGAEVNQSNSHLCEFHSGAVIGATVVLLSMLMVILYIEKRTVRNTKGVNTVTEVV